jgi:hypothetical protein
MTEGKASKTRRAAKKEPTAPVAMDAHAVRARLIEKVLNDADAILGQVIEAAKTGNYLPAKFLFEFAGILEPLQKPEGEGEAETQARLRSLVDLLLDSAQKPQPGPSQETLSA